MPYTVTVSFNKFIENITLSGDHREVAQSRKDRVVSLLSNDFTIIDAFATGSIPRLTALKAKADLDVMVVLHFGKHIEASGGGRKAPSAVLQAVRDSLGQYRTGVRKNGQAVTLSYDTWPDVDIVPVSYTANDDGSINHYNVPDMTTETWIESRPKTHTANIKAKASACGPEFRHVIRMAKDWNRAHSEILESFHLEVLALKAFDDAQMGDYPWEVFQFFDKAAAMITKSLWYEGDYADSYLTPTTRRDAQARLETARDRARSAWNLTYGKNSNDEGAIKIWRQIFSDKFPPYG